MAEIQTKNQRGIWVVREKFSRWFDSQKESHLLVILFLLGCLFYGCFLGARDLWEPDESRQVLMNLEMARDGWKIFPTFRGDLYPDYPPLSYWLTLSVARGLEVVGVSHALQRPWIYQIPAMFFTILTALCLFVLVSRRYDRNMGALASLIFLASPMVFLQGQRVMLDPILMGWLTLFFALFSHHLGHPKKIHFPLFFLLLILTWLTKGPVGVLLISAVVVIYFASFREWKKALLYGLFLGVSICSIASVWYYLAYSIHGAPFFYEVFFNQTLGRFLPPSFLHWLSGFFPPEARGLIHVNPDHQRPFWYYFLKFPGLFAPWIVFGALGFYLAFRHSEDRLALVWFGVVFVLFSISKNKRTYYLLPLFPPAAILAARGLQQGLENWQKYIKFLALLLGVILVMGGLGGLVFYFVAPLFPQGLARVQPFLAPLWMPFVLLVALSLVGAGGGMFFLAKKDRLWEGCALLVLSTALGGWLFWWLALPGLNHEKSYQPICQYLRKRLPASKKVVFYHMIRNSFETNLRHYQPKKAWRVHLAGKIIRLNLDEIDIYYGYEGRPLAPGEVRESVVPPYLLVMPRREYERVKKQGFRAKKVGEKSVDHRIWKFFLIQ